VIEGGVISFVRADHIGRPVFATTAAGTKVWSATYLPFGGVHVATGPLPSARFPGQWFQSKSGLHQNWMACCRFHGHEDKIVTKEPESGYDETEVQP
jgi:hypothetical protein